MEPKTPKVAIIVPFIGMEDYVKECIIHCLKLDYPNFELVLLPDEPLKERFNDKRIRIIPTGKVHQSVKRNIAISSKDLKFDIGASIDSDAYPRRDWLKNAVNIFLKDKTVGAVGGPNSKPHKAGLKERVAIDIVHSRVGVGGAYYIRRYGKNAEVVKELPSSNLLFKREVLQKIKGYPTSFKTGEDTIMCFNLRKLGYLIIDSKDVVVYHHRRPLFKKHLERVYEQGIDKVIILRKKLTLDKLIYFIPAGFVLFLIAGIISMFISQILFGMFLSVMALYFLALFIESLTKKELFGIPLFILGTFLTHVTYGLGFIRGTFGR